ncbi:hypothetical protein Q8F55_004933 [Vanrija albida]|uniref:Major facilitator superfamily (MFS) profile domain-containing protein n=1 Tax=Vanrija albida TaxID=181172 RepID=A0ABR3Q084_9TREE
MDNEDSSAKQTGYELSSLSVAARRPSRASAGHERPSFALSVLRPLAPEHAVDDDGDDDKIYDSKIGVRFDALPEIDGALFARAGEPRPGPSIPPTPTERAFDSGGMLEGGDAAEVDAALRASPSPELEEDAAAAQASAEASAAPLPPVDGGREAWAFLAAGTLVEVMVWGLPFSMGVLLEYWSNTLFHDRPGAEKTLALAATLPTAVLYFLGAPLGPLFTALPWYEKPMMLGGLVVATAGLIASAFATEPWHLVLTVGIMFTFSGLTYYPCATIIFEWWHVRVGMASGIMYAGTGLGGTLYPFLVTALLNKVGYRWTMIAISIIFFALNAAALPFIKRRIPLPPRPKLRLRRGERRGPRRRVFDLGWLKNPAPWTAFATVFLGSLGNFIPAVWLPVFAASVSISKPSGTSLIAIMNAVTVVGQTLGGWLSDRVPVRIIMCVQSVFAALACVLLWGQFGTSAAGLTAFTIVWSLTAGSMAGLWASLIRVFAKGDPAVPPLGFSVFMTLRGIGNLASGPIATALLGMKRFPGAGGAYGHTDYGALAIYTGTMMVAGGCVIAFFPSK